MKPKWERQEPGWWTHEKLGGICKEIDGYWWCYRADPPPGAKFYMLDKHGPHKTLKAAIAEAEKTGKESK